MGFLTGLLKAGYGVGKAGVGSLPSIGRFGFEAGTFAIRHPYMTAGAVGGAAYLSMSGTGTSPTLTGVEMGMNINREQEMVAEMDTGVSPMGSHVSGAAVRNQRFMESTMGLTQGLHRSRH